MVLIDSSPWIDLLSGTRSAEARLLDAWLRERVAVATAGVVLQEILQGARTERDVNLLRGRLGRLPFLRADKETHIEAARLHRRVRGRGWIVPAADALIAAIAVAHGVALLTADRKHFEALARVSKLRLAG
jgi:hypothetical protein